MNTTQSNKSRKEVKEPVNPLTEIELLSKEIKHLKELLSNKNIVIKELLGLVNQIQSSQSAPLCSSNP